MIKKLLPFLTVIVFACNLQISKSQSCTFFVTRNIYKGTDSNLTTLPTCGSYDVKYTLINTTPGYIACAFSCTVHLPDGITGSSTVFKDTSNDGANFSYSFTDPNNPVISINSTTTLDHWNIGDTISFTFEISTPCCVGSSITQSDTLTLSNGCIAIPPSPVTIYAPDLHVTGIYPGAGTNPQNVGNVVDFVFQITDNNVTLPINQYVDTHCPTVSYMTMLGYFFSRTKNTSVDSSATWCNYDTDSHFVRANDSLIQANTSVYNSIFGTTYFPAVSTFYLHIIYQVTSCKSSGDTLNFVLFCSTGGSDPTCYPGQNVVVQMDVTPGIPNISAVPTLPIYIDSSRANYCSGDTNSITLGFILTNNGTDATSGAKGNARADSIRVYLFTSYELGLIDTATLKINGYHFAWSPGFVTQVPNTNTNDNNLLGFTVWQLDFSKLSFGCTPPFGPGSIADLNADSFANQLSNTAGQNTFTLTVDFIYRPESNNKNNPIYCPLSFLNSCGDSYDIPLGINILYQNECGTLDSNIYPEAEKYRVTDGPKYQYLYGTQENAPTLTSATSQVDIVEPTTPPFLIDVCPGQFTQEWSDTNYIFKCPYADYRLTLNLPPGYQIDFILKEHEFARNHVGNS